VTYSLFKVREEEIEPIIEQLFGFDPLNRISIFISFLPSAYKKILDLS